MEQARAEDDYRRGVTRRAMREAHAMQRSQDEALSKVKREAMPYTAKLNSLSIINARESALRTKRHVS